MISPAQGMLLNTSKIANFVIKACSQVNNRVGQVRSELNKELGHQDLQIIDRELILDSWLRVEKVRLKHKLIERGWSGELQRELLVKQSAVGVLLFDPQRDEILLVRQFRIGVIDSKQSPWLLELVAGLVDSGEEPADVVKREAMEEADCEPTDLIHICDYYSSPGASTEAIHLYCGRVDTGSAGGVFGLDDEGEDIEVVVMRYDDVLSAVQSGQINNAMSLIAIQWLQLNKGRVLQRWLQE